MHWFDPLTGRMLPLAMLLPLAVQVLAVTPNGKIQPNLPLIEAKTLVAWVAPANLQQRGGGVLTLEAGAFDAIVFGERAEGRWMAGSEMFRRTQPEQEQNTRETAGPAELVQIATVYEGRSVTLYRNGQRYARYEVEQPVKFSSGATVLMGLRHMDRQGQKNAHFAGTIADARIYDRALDAATLAELRPKTASTPEPLGWWTFDEGKAIDRMGRFPEGELHGGATISNGMLHLDGKDGFMKTPTLTSCSPIHYRPAQGVFADPIPLFWQGEYHIFYLRGSIGKVPWEHIVSRDLIHWRELPTALVSDGADDSPDGLHMFTGSAIEKDGTFTIFYTGYNPQNPRGREIIRRATSPDLIHWTKQPGELNPDGVIYSDHQARDWRDPYVFWNEAEGCYWMVVIANRVGDHQGVQGLLTSPDMAHWTCQQPLAEAGAQECPDLFKIDKTWYLIGGDHYLTASTPRGPFTQPKQMMIDRPGVYAGKRMFDGKRHIWVGWAWDRNPYRDEGEGIWGGTMSLPRELAVDPAGGLFCRPVAEALTPFTQTALELTTGTILGLPDGVKTARLTVPADYLLEAELKLEPGSECTVVLREQAGGEGYRLTLRPAAAQVTLSGPGFSWPREGCRMDTTQPIRLRAFVMGDLIECFVNDAWALSCRAYNFPDGVLGFDAIKGQVVFQSIRIKTIPAE